MTDLDPTDPDLPGDADFHPIPPIVYRIMGTPSGPVIAMAMTVSPAEQANIHHNQLRYAELQKLRLGQPNLYNETRYRNG